MPVPAQLVSIPAQSATSMLLRAGDILRIVDLYGEQVADLALFNADDVRDSFSGGRTIDYNQSVRLKLDDVLYSNRSTPLARVVRDSVGVHDLLLAPCSEAMFASRGEYAHASCHGNLAAALHPYGILPDMVSATLNVFMDVRVDETGGVRIFPPPTKAGDCFAVEAACDLIIGLAACSSELTNNGTCKPLGYEVL